MKIKQKMIILQKSNPSLASAKTAIFPFIFPFHFHRSFKLRFNASHWHIDTSFSRTTVYLPLHRHLPSPLWHDESPVLHPFEPPNLCTSNPNIHIFRAPAKRFDLPSHVFWTQPCCKNRPSSSYFKHQPSVSTLPATISNPSRSMTANKGQYKPMHTYSSVEGIGMAQRCDTSFGPGIFFVYLFFHYWYTMI